MKRWPIIIAIIAGVIFSYLGLSSNATLYDHAKRRADYSEFTDYLSACDQTVTSEGFYDKESQCKEFLATDASCEFFPERNPACIDFLSKPSYQTKRTSCRDWSAQMALCDKKVRDTRWHAPLAWVINSSFMNKLSQYTGYTLEDLSEDIASFYGIRIDEPWYDYLRRIDANERIYIATIAPVAREREFFQGVDLAGELLNRKGGVLGRQLAFVRRVDDGTPDKAREIAKELVKNKRVAAVITRLSSAATKPITLLYEQGGLINLIVSATNVNIIRPNMKYNFRMTPNNNQMAKASADHCFDIGCRRVAIVLSRDPYSQELGRAFYDEALNIGIKTAYQKTFFSNRSDFTDIINGINEAGVDAVYLASMADAAADFAYQSRRFGMNAPIIGTDTLDNKEFISLAGSAGEGILIPSIYNETLVHTENADFVLAYRNKYGKLPDTWAAQGYDAVNLVAQSMINSGSTDPLKVASILRYTEQWKGAGGKFHFSESGEIEGRDIFLKKLSQGEFHSISLKDYPKISATNVGHITIH